MFQFLSVLPFRSMIRSGDLDPSSSNWFCSLSYLWDLMLYAWLTIYVLTPKYIYTQYLHSTVVYGITANYFIKTFDAFVRWYHFKTQMFRSRSVQRSGWAEHCSVSSHPRHLLVHFWHCTALLWITLHCLALVVCCRPPLGQFQLPDALKDAHLRHPRDSISLSPRLSGCLQGRCSDWKIGSWILLFLRSPSGLFLPPFFLSSSASSVHEPRRHIVGPSEQHVGVVPARLGLVREPLCVVESFQRGVDVVVVPTRGVSCTKSSQFEGEGGSCASGMN